MSLIDTDNVYLTLLLNFMLLSLMAVGGANVLLPEMHQFAVESRGWITAKEFPELFALAQAAPGPNVLFVSVIGWKAAGVFGAGVAMFGICAPSTVLTLFVAHYLERFRAAPWRIALQKALAPVAAGLITTSGILLVRGAGQTTHALLVSAAVVLISIRYNPNPLWFIAGGAVLGLLFF